MGVWHGIKTGTKVVGGTIAVLLTLGLGQYIFSPSYKKLVRRKLFIGGLSLLTAMYVWENRHKIEDFVYKSYKGISRIYEHKVEGDIKRLQEKNSSLEMKVKEKENDIKRLASDKEEAKSDAEYFKKEYVKMAEQKPKVETVYVPQPIVQQTIIEKEKRVEVPVEKVVYVSKSNSQERNLEKRVNNVVQNNKQFRQNEIDVDKSEHIITFYEVYNDGSKSCLAKGLVSLPQNGPRDLISEVDDIGSRTGDLSPGIIKYDEKNPVVVITASGENNEHLNEINNKMNSNKTGIRTDQNTYNRIASKLFDNLNNYNSYKCVVNVHS